MKEQFQLRNSKKYNPSVGASSSQQQTALHNYNVKMKVLKYIKDKSASIGMQSNAIFR